MEIPLGKDLEGKRISGGDHRWQRHGLREAESNGEIAVARVERSMGTVQTYPDRLWEALHVR